MKFMKPLRLYHDFLKLNTAKPGWLLGLDVDDNSVAVTVSDCNKKRVSPLRYEFHEFFRLKTLFIPMFDTYLQCLREKKISVWWLQISKIWLVLNYTFFLTVNYFYDILFDLQISELSVSAFIVWLPYDRQWCHQMQVFISYCYFTLEFKI